MCKTRKIMLNYASLSVMLRCWLIAWVHVSSLLHFSFLFFFFALVLIILHFIFVYFVYDIIVNIWTRLFIPSADNENRYDRGENHDKHSEKNTIKHSWWPKYANYLHIDKILTWHYWCMYVILSLKLFYYIYHHGHLIRKTIKHNATNQS